MMADRCVMIFRDQGQPALAAPTMHFQGRPAGRPYEDLTNREIDIAVFCADDVFVGATRLVAHITALTSVN